MKRDVGIYHQSKDNLYIAKVFHKRKEYYVGGFKDKEEAIEARKTALEDILNGNAHKYRSRVNCAQSINFDTESNSVYLNDPEYRLRYAILMTALRDACHPDRPEYKKSRNWILGESYSEDTFSFDDICELFKLNAAAVREKINNLDEETKKRITNSGYID